MRKASRSETGDRAGPTVPSGNETSSTTTESVENSKTAPSGVVEAARRADARRTVDELARLDEGDAVSVTVGKETFFPVKFNGFEVGPVSVTVRVRAGESAGQAYARASVSARVMFEAEFEQKRKEYDSRLDEVRG